MQESLIFDKLNTFPSATDNNHNINNNAENHSLRKNAFQKHTNNSDNLSHSIHNQV